MDRPTSLELLESIHQFPGVFQIKAIGRAGDDFEARVLSAAHEEVASPSEVDHSSRTTPGGRHIAVTLDITVQTAEQVHAIYARIRDVPGLLLLL